MFDIINGNTIQLSRGDTGAIKFTADAKYRGTDTPYTFGERDRAVFSIKNASGTLVKEKYCELTNNQFVVVFFNADTDSLLPGRYSWDVRFVINPRYDDPEDLLHRRIVDGDQVITPNEPADANLLSVVGDI